MRPSRVVLWVCDPCLSCDRSIDVGTAALITEPRPSRTFPRNNRSSLADGELEVGVEATSNKGIATTNKGHYYYIISSILASNKNKGSLAFSNN